MTLLCFASQKGSPGASAAALAVAAALRPGEGRRKLLLEADIAGGVLAVRYRLPVEPGLVTLAAAARAGLEEDDLWRHAVELPGGLPAVVCPDGSDRVHAALAAAGGPLGRYLANLADVDVICDIGRLPPDSPAVDLVAEATALLMVARPTAEQLQPAARRLLALRPQISNVGWLLIGDQPHGPRQVEETFGLPVVGVLADDRRSVTAIENGELSKRVRRHPFVRSATSVADILAGWLVPRAVTPTAPPSQPSVPVDGPVGVGLADLPAPGGSSVPVVGPVEGPGSDGAPLLILPMAEVPPTHDGPTWVDGSPREAAPAEPLRPLEAPEPRFTPQPEPQFAPARPAALDLASLPPPQEPTPPGPATQPLAEPIPLPVERTPTPITASAQVANPDPRSADGPARPPDPPTPFVHGDDDIEWTAS